ncbi:MAG: signal peptidase II [Planctomycetaceae bacterium]|nr:signal peptidase II [Planctomycetaceae bacterium]
MNRPPLSRAILFCVIAAAGAAVDVVSKDVVFNDLGLQYMRDGAAHSVVEGRHELFDFPEWREGESDPWLQGWMTFRLYTSINHGALWGMGQGLTWLFATLSVLAAGAILFWLFIYGAARSLWLTVALSLIMSGTLGNLYDRMGLHGYLAADSTPIHGVRDFLLFTFGNFAWPVFNFADVFLVTGAIMLAVQSLFFPEAHLAGDPAQNSATDQAAAGDAPAGDSSGTATVQAASKTPAVIRDGSTAAEQVA